MRATLTFRTNGSYIKFMKNWLTEEDCTFTIESEHIEKGVTIYTIYTKFTDREELYDIVEFITSHFNNFELISMQQQSSYDNTIFTSPKNNTLLNKPPQKRIT